MGKKNIAVLFGGQSSEHEVSCMSVMNVAANIDTDKYNVILVGITKDGRWLLADSLGSVADGTWRDGGTQAILSPDAADHGLILIRGGAAGKTDRERERTGGADGGRIDAAGEGRIDASLGETDSVVGKIRLDAVFPVLHGLYGEDGTVQGIMELARIPYVGNGVLSSAVSMDKLTTKVIAAGIGIRQAAYVPVMKYELSSMEALTARVEKALPYPVFIKPCNSGSSCGVTRANDRRGLMAGLLEASRHDRRILVEEAIAGHEVECAVLGGGEDGIMASGVGEILAAADFYDYDAKYNNSESKTVIDPSLPGDSAETVRRQAVEIFKAVDGYGLARVDFFVKEDGSVIFNEINTMPGFTAISMYPMLWEARGIGKKELCGMLIENALKRFYR